MRRRSLHIVRAIAAFGAALAACQRHSGAKEQPDPDPPRLTREADGREVLELRASEIPGLTFTAVKPVDLPRTLETTGQVTLDDRRVATIISRVSGRVEEVYVSQWDSVSRGEAIVALYSPDYMTAAAEYVQAAATSRLSTGEGLSDAPKLSVAIVEAARRKLELLGIDAADIQAMDAARTTFRMRAPISGTVVQKEVVKGSQVNPGDVLFSLGVTDEVWITADVYENDLARVREGQELEAVPVAFPDRTFKGVIARVSPTIDPATHTAQIRCQVHNRSLALKPQMLMRVRIATSTGEALVVPQDSLVFETDAYYAFVEVEPGRILRRQVAIASWNEGGYARVLGGLLAGERVIQGESIQANALWHRAHGETS
jgi:membrane fusion protein, copper/silver efflux system